MHVSPQLSERSCLGDVFSAKQITFFSLALLNIGNMNAVLAFGAAIGGQFPCLCLIYLIPRDANMYEWTQLVETISLCAYLNWHQLNYKFR